MIDSFNTIGCKVGRLFPNTGINLPHASSPGIPSQLGPMASLARMPHPAITP